MDADLFETADVLFLNGLVCALLVDGCHQVLANALFVRFAYQNELETRRHDIFSMLLILILPVPLDDSSELNGGSVIYVDLDWELPLPQAQIT